VPAAKRADLARWRLPALGLILLLALGLRVLRAGKLDLNDDEAFFVQITHLGTYWSLAGSTEPHPPLYLALLQGWMLLGGVTEYAVRFPSIVFGVATAAGMYQLGRLLAGERLGLAAALVAALNPYQIAYSQTARDYEIACCLALLSFVVFLHALRRPRVLPGYAAVALLAIFSHYYAIAILLLEQALLVWWFLRGKLPEWRRWLAADVALAVVYLPWSLYSLRTVVGYEPGHGTPQIVWSALRDTFEFDTFGLNFRPDDIVWPSIAAGVLLLFGIIGLAVLPNSKFQIPNSRATPLGMALAYQAAPLAFGVATLVHTKQFGARFLFLGSPGYLLILAGALVLLWRWWRVAIVLPIGLLAGLTGFAVHNAVFTDAFVTKGYSRLGAYLASHAAPNDTVVLDAVSQTIQYWYYAELRNAVSQQVEIMPRDAAGNGADGTPVDVLKTEAALRQIAATSSGMWLVDDDSLRYDPHLDTQRIIAAHWSRASSQVFVNQRLDFYSTAMPAPPAGVNFVLDGFQLSQASAIDQPVPAGQPLALHLVWTATRNQPRAFKESLRLLDASGAIVSQQDLSPGGGFVDFDAWRTGHAVDDHPGLMTPVGLAPGEYKLQLVGYDAASGAALGSPVDLQDVAVDHSAPQRASAADLPMVGAPVAGEILAAAGADTLTPGAGPGGRTSDAAEIAAGERLRLTLLWSGGPTVEAQDVSIALGPVQIAHRVGGTYTTDRWQPNDVVRDDMSLRVPVSLQPGPYPLTVGGVRLADVKVLPARRNFTAPAVAHPLAVQFGDVAELLGYDLSVDPGLLHVHLVWKALAETSTSYTVFAHALDADGKVIGQADIALGTDNWAAGEIVSADYQLPLPGPASKLEVGLYDARDGSRLQACAAASACADHLELPLSG
jgi:mannosyltransferase